MCIRDRGWVQTLLRAKGWIVPNYELPPNLEKVQILRVVVRENVTESLIEVLVQDLISITRHLMEQQRVARTVCKDSASATNMTNMLLTGHYAHQKNHGRPDGHGQPPKGYKSQC